MKYKGDTPFLYLICDMRKIKMRLPWKRSVFDFQVSISAWYKKDFAKFRKRSVLLLFFLSFKFPYRLYIEWLSQFQTDWVVYGSPLWHKDTVQEYIKPLPGVKERLSLEKNFVNDAIKTQIYNYPRKKPIIPVYSARKDKCAQAYFQSPLVKSLLNREKMSAEVSALVYIWNIGVGGSLIRIYNTFRYVYTV